MKNKKQRTSGQEYATNNFPKTGSHGSQKPRDGTTTITFLRVSGKNELCLQLKIYLIISRSTTGLTCWACIFFVFELWRYGLEYVFGCVYLCGSVRVSNSFELYFFFGLLLLGIYRKSCSEWFFWEFLFLRWTIVFSYSGIMYFSLVKLFFCKSLKICSGWSAIRLKREKKERERNINWIFVKLSTCVVVT